MHGLETIKHINETVCFELPGSSTSVIRLTQQGVDNFTVQYGKQVERRLDYTQAATALGAAIMHAAACDDKLDNREIGEE